jgi:hypothetical protein
MATKNPLNNSVTQYASVASVGGAIGVTGPSGAVSMTNYSLSDNNVSVNDDIIINGVSLSGTLNRINDRLAILQPKPELLEKYANLREAYEHYKTLERLLSEYADDK